MGDVLEEDSGGGGGGVFVLVAVTSGSLVRLDAISSPLFPSTQIDFFLPRIGFPDTEGGTCGGNEAADAL